MTICICLEANLCADHELAHRGAISDVMDAATTTIVHVCVGKIEVDVVQNVEELELQLSFD